MEYFNGLLGQTSLRRSAFRAMPGLAAATAARLLRCDLKVLLNNNEDCAMIRLLGLCCVVFILGFVAQLPAVDAAYIETINPAATPATPEVRVFYSIFDNIGWYYTPNTSYTLTGIYSNFGPNDSASGINHITLQVQTERPAKGGVVLAEAMFDGQNAVGGLLGASFAPIPLTASQTYFVNYLHLSGMGVNLGTWDEDQFGTRYPSGGATTNLGVYYRDDDNGFDTEETNTWEVSGGGLARVSGAEPILFFEGFGVPEPCSIELLSIAVLLGVGNRRIRKRGKKEAA
jgi:hypothetical protein